MSFSTVNLSFQDDFLVQIDRIANEESKTRGDIINEAVKIYINRKRKLKNISRKRKTLLGLEINSFWSKRNQDRLEESRKAAEAGILTEHELIEVD